MTIIGFGLSHKTAPFSLLERVSFTPEAMDAFLASLRASGEIREAFGLSTCNRTEFLLAADNSHQALAVLLSRLLDAKGIDLRQDADHTFFHAEDTAIRHIFRVACGIDSLVIGENEILGQLRRAREAASDASHISDMLEPIILRAIDVGRRARQATTISRGNVSVASVAATLATRCLGDLADKEGVVLGAGETAEAAAFQLSERGLKNLTIANRTYERAQLLANSMGARDAAIAEIGPVLARADVVVCATSAPHYLITQAMVQAAMAARTHKPILFLDVSVPRNVDPAAIAVENVHVFSLEHLNQLAEENRAEREAQVLKVEEIIDQELVAFQSARTSVDTHRLVAALHRRVEQLRREHINRHGHHFDAAQLAHLDLFSSGLTRSVLHELVDNLRGLNLETAEGRHRYEIAQELLNLAPDDGGD